MGAHSLCKRGYVLTAVYLATPLLQARLGAVAFQELPPLPFSTQAIQSILTVLLTTVYYRVNPASWRRIGIRRIAGIAAISTTYIANIAIIRLCEPYSKIAAVAPLLLAAMDAVSANVVTQSPSNGTAILSILISGVALRLNGSIASAQAPFTEAGTIVMSAILHFCTCAARLYLMQKLDFEIHELICRVHIITFVMAAAFALGRQESAMWYGAQVLTGRRVLVILAHALTIYVGTMTSLDAYRLLSATTIAVLLNVLQTMNDLRSSLPGVAVALVGAGIHLVPRLDDIKGPTSLLSV